MSMLNKWNDIIKSYLNEDDPFMAFRELLIEMKAEGISSEVAYAYFENLRKELSESGDEKDEDKILQVMDIISGFCSPHLRVW
jgi:hypothetical protein